jgi:hypothetical protein
VALASNGGKHGVWGQSESTSGMGVLWNAVATTGLTLVILAGSILH